MAACWQARLQNLLRLSFVGAFEQKAQRLRPLPLAALEQAMLQNLVFLLGSVFEQKRQSLLSTTEEGLLARKNSGVFDIGLLSLLAADWPDEMKYTSMT
jgi:hypothetical protein